MENIPKKSDIESQTEDDFSDLKIGNEQELDSKIKEVFEEICGEYGKEEFFNFVLPTIKKIYGSNYRKAGFRLLEIIDKGSAKKPDEISDFFKNCISRREIEFSNNKDKIIKEMYGKIKTLLKNKKEEYGENYKGVIAVIIYGGYAKANIREDSDIDVLYVTESKDEGDMMKKTQRYIHYLDDFDSDLRRITKKEIDNFNGSVSIDDREELRTLVYSDSNVIQGQYVVIVSDETVKANIEGILQKKET